MQSDIPYSMRRQNVFKLSEGSESRSSEKRKFVDGQSLRREKVIISAESWNIFYRRPIDLGLHNFESNRREK
jgi:hypothetical protein